MKADIFFINVIALALIAFGLWYFLNTPCNITQHIALPRMDFVVGVF